MKALPFFLFPFFFFFFSPSTCFIIYSHTLLPSLSILTSFHIIFLHSLFSIKVYNSNFNLIQASMSIPAKPPSLPRVPNQASVQLSPTPVPVIPMNTNFGGVITNSPMMGDSKIDMSNPEQIALEQEYRILIQQMMDKNKNRITFKFEPHLRRQFGFGLDPDRPICPFWNDSNGNTCPYGRDCPLKHPSKIFKNKIVCKYWLRGLCKMGDDCDFLHEYNLSKMPECAYYAANGVCLQADECIYLHVDPKSKIPECYNYSNLGFCPEGPKCPRRHVRKVMCPRYLAGFCPKGPECELAHPKFKPGLLLQSKFKIMTDEEIIAKRLQEMKEAKKEAEGKNAAKTDSEH